MTELIKLPDESGSASISRQIRMLRKMVDEENKINRSIIIRHTTFTRNLIMLAFGVLTSLFMIVIHNTSPEDERLLNTILILIVAYPFTNWIYKKYLKELGIMRDIRINEERMNEDIARGELHND